MIVHLPSNLDRLIPLNMQTLPIVLASSSPYRRQLLERLHLPFTYLSPNIDESAHIDENATQRAERLATAKAKAISNDFPNHLIIGSDQIAEIDNQQLGKPGCREKAIQQLLACNGRTVAFKTGLCLLNSHTQQHQAIVETFSVNFRHLSQEEIERYVDKEKPFDCAGSFKCEGLGISLFTSMSGRDPNTLIGLPLIALCDMLRQEGIQLP